MGQEFLSGARPACAAVCTGSIADHDMPCVMFRLPQRTQSLEELKHAEQTRDPTLQCLHTHPSCAALHTHHCHTSLHTQSTCAACTPFCVHHFKHGHLQMFTVGTLCLSQGPLSAKAWPLSRFTTFLFMGSGLHKTPSETTNKSLGISNRIQLII